MVALEYVAVGWEGVWSGLSYTHKQQRRPLKNCTIWIAIIYNTGESLQELNTCSKRYCFNAVSRAQWLPIWVTVVHWLRIWASSTFYQWLRIWANIGDNATSPMHTAHHILVYWLARLRKAGRRQELMSGAKNSFQSPACWSGELGEVRTDATSWQAAMALQ